MRRITEFYPERQGRPTSIETVDLETGQGSLYHNYIYFKGEYDRMEKLLDKLLNEQIQQLEKMLIEARQIKLHLASLSDAAIDEQDAEEE